MRYLSAAITKDLARKLVLLTGPRQSGKTTLAKGLGKSFEYLNFDVPEERLAILNKSWDRSRGLLILDELHKLKKWKLFLKGLVDSSAHTMQTLVTGSARLDIARKVGDSLAGRYLLFHLHPIDVKEASDIFGVAPEDALQRIMTVSGFPEPFLENQPGEYARWRRSHSDIILRQDLLDLESVEQITKLETLVELLRTRVGSPITYANLATTLDVAPKTVKRWLGILENLYIVFRVQPYATKLARAIVKSPKYYFYDSAMVVESGARFENLVACALLKEVDLRRDCFGDEIALHFVRNRDEAELDFLLLKNRKPWLAIEAKTSDDTPHRAFRVFAPQLQLKKAIQLVADLRRDKTYESGLEIRSAAPWLAKINFG